VLETNDFVELAHDMVVHLDGSTAHARHHAASAMGSMRITHPAAR
jgi:hypothetical protein